jgi:hypothetical protein
VGGGVFFFLGKDSDDKTSQSSSTVTSTSTEAKKTTSAEAPKLVAQTVGKDADCSTYTFKELEGVWGVPFTDTDINKVTKLSTSGGKQYACSYNETNSGMGVTLSVEVREHPSVEAAKQSMNDTRSTEKYGDTVYYLKEDKAGVGDEAFLWARNRTDGSKESNQQLYVRKGSVVFLLSGVNLAGVDTTYKDKLVASYKLHFK